MPVEALVPASAAACYGRLLGAAMTEAPALASLLFYWVVTSAIADYFLTALVAAIEVERGLTFRILITRFVVESKIIFDY